MGGLPSVYTYLADVGGRQAVGGEGVHQLGSDYRHLHVDAPVLNRALMEPNSALIEPQ